MELEKVKSFAILILTISLISSYFMIYQLLANNKKLQHQVNDLEIVIRVNEIIKRTGKNGG
jgi:hypothetical protein